MTLGTPKTMTVGDVSLAYYEMGEGPLVVCTHGYPDTAETFDVLLPALAQAGFRAVAPFLRGYHPSSASPPTDPMPYGDYRGLTLGQDILGLIKGLGEKRASLVGHDWGALASLSAVAQADDAVGIEALVTLGIPHPRSIKPSIRGVWKARHFLAYQLKKRATRKLKANDYKHIADIFKRWSPTWAPDAEELERSKRCFREPGVAEAALGFYWAWMAEQKDKQARRILASRVSIPTLAVGGLADGALLPGAYERTSSCFTGHYEMALLEGVGHFPHREAPDEVIPRIVAFMTAHGLPQK